MIKISSNQVTVWKSATFTYPALSGTSSTLVSFNHNLALSIDSCNLIWEENSTSHPIIYNMDRNTGGGAFYGFRADGSQDKYTLTVRLYRFAGSSVDAHAKLVSYGG